MRHGEGRQLSFWASAPEGAMPHVLTTCTSIRYIMLHYVMLCYITLRLVIYPPPPSPPLPHVTEGGAGGEDMGLRSFQEPMPHPSPLTTPLKWGIRVPMPNNTSAFLLCFTKDEQSPVPPPQLPQSLFPIPPISHSTLCMPPHQSLHPCLQSLHPVPLQNLPLPCLLFLIQPPQSFRSPPSLSTLPPL